MVTMDTGNQLHDSRPVHDPDTYRWPPRPRWGLPEEVLDRRSLPHEISHDLLVHEDVMWTAWAFAGARCARTFWRRMGHRMVTRSALASAREAVMEVLRWAQLGHWLPFDAAKVGISFAYGARRRGDFGLTLRVDGIDDFLARGFLAGWQVAAAAIAERSIADGSWR